MSQPLTQEQENFLADVVAEQFGKTLDFARFADAALRGLSQLGAWTVT